MSNSGNSESNAYAALFGGSSEDYEEKSLNEEGMEDEELEGQEGSSKEASGGKKESAALAAAMKISPGAIVVYLLKGYIERDANRVLFESLTRQETAVNDLCSRLFLRLVIDEDNGYAYVRSLAEEELAESDMAKPPKLLSTRRFTVLSSLVLILLRQRLLEFDMSGQFGRFVMTRAEIFLMAKTFINNVNNDKRLDDRLDRAVEDLINSKLLVRIDRGDKKNKNERLEVKRIISVIVTPEILREADDLLESYIKDLNSSRSRSDLIADNEVDNSSDE